MDYSVMSDEELLLRFYAGDDAAFEALFWRYYPRLTGSAFRRLPSRAGRWQDAEQLAIDALVNVHRTRENPLTRWAPVGGVLPAWLFTILHHLISDRTRAKRRDVTFTDFGPDDGDDEAPVESQLLAAADLAPLAQMCTDEVLEALEGCIDGLPDNERNVVIMRRDGLTFEAIAKILRFSIAKVHRLFRRACERLVRCMRDKGLTDPPHKDHLQGQAHRGVRP